MVTFWKQTGNENLEVNDETGCAIASQVGRAGDISITSEEKNGAWSRLCNKLELVAEASFEKSCYYMWYHPKAYLESIGNIEGQLAMAVGREVPLQIINRGSVSGPCNKLASAYEGKRCRILS